MSTHPEFCAQEGTLVAITKTLDRMERAQEKVVELLEKVANQEAKISHLQENSERSYNDVNELFTRVRDCEMNVASSGPSVRQHFHEATDQLNDKLDKLARFASAITGRPAVFLYILLIVMVGGGTFCDVMYHFETLKSFILFVRG